MKWFKHYENASTNRLIQALLMEKNGHELHSMYWLLLELLCGEFKKNTTVFTLSIEQINNALRVKYSRKSERFLQVLGEFAERFDRDLLKLEQISEKFWKIETPIILELMGKDFKRTRQGRGTDTAKKKEERKKKERDIGAREKAREISHSIINPDQAIDLWNKVLVPIGFEPARIYPASKLKDFLRFSKAVGGKKEWIKLLESIPDSWLGRGASNFSFSWFFDEERAAKILNGEYGTVIGEPSTAKIKNFFKQGEIDD